MEEFSVIDRIKLLMTQRDIKMSELAMRCGWPMSKVSKIFRGNQKITTDDLITIAFALNENPAILISPDMSDVIDTRRTVTELGHIFTQIGMYRNDKNTLVQLIENELPHTMASYLSLRDTGKSVDVMLRPRRMNREENEFISCPRVTITDKSEGQLFRNQLTVGYWFDENWRGVYLTIHYMKRGASRESMGAAAMASTKDMREWFTALSDGEFNCRERMRLGEKSSRNHMMYETGTIFCKRYDFEQFFDEDQLKNDLRQIYDMYLQLLDTATVRVQETYENMYQSQRERERRENNDDQGSFDISDLDRIMPVTVQTQELSMRDKKAAKIVLQKSGYMCECDGSHTSFISRNTGKPYMQAHQLIPRSAQSDFNVSLQVTENFCCLCPNCHLRLEHGTDADRQEMLMHLYMKHKEGLKNVGIEVTLLQLFKYYGMN